MSSRHSATLLGAIVGTCALVLTGMTQADASTTRSVSCHGAGGGTAGLRAAIEKANSNGGGQISLAKDCTYTFSDGPFEDQSGANALPIITTPIVIKANHSTLTRQSQQRFRFFEVSASGALRLQDVTLSRGRTESDVQQTNNGGAIFSVGGLVVRHATLKRNSSANGGAIEADGGSVRVVQSSLVRNHARDVPGATAGAIAIDGARATIREVTLARNDAYAKGGALAVFSGSVRISDSTLADNKLSINGQGGAIFNFGRLAITRTSFTGNQANGYGGNGGAIANYDEGRLSVTDSRIQGNTAGTAGKSVSKAFGGGIANFGDAELARLEITRNRAQGGKARGGGIAVKSGALSIVKSTVAHNSPTNCSGPIKGHC